MVQIESSERAHLGWALAGAPPPPPPRGADRILERGLFSAEAIWGSISPLARPLRGEEPFDAGAPHAPLLFELLSFLDAHATPRVTPLTALLVRRWARHSPPALLLARLLEAWTLELVVDQLDIARGPGGRLRPVRTSGERFRPRQTPRLARHPRPALSAARFLRAHLARVGEGTRVEAQIVALEALGAAPMSLAHLLAYLFPAEPLLVEAAWEAREAVGPGSLLLLTCEVEEPRRHRLTEALARALLHKGPRTFGEGPRTFAQGPVEVERPDPGLWLAGWTLPDALERGEASPALLASLYAREESRGQPFRLGDTEVRLVRPPPEVGGSAVGIDAGHAPPLWSAPEALPALLLEDGRVLDAAGASDLLGALRRWRGQPPEDWRPGFQPERLAAWVEAVIAQWRAQGAQLPEAWCLKLLGMLTTPDAARVALSTLPAWPSEGLTGQALLALEQVAERALPERSSDPDPALRALTELARRAAPLRSGAQMQIARLAEAWALPDDVRDERCEPTLGLDEEEAWRFDYGRRAFRLELDPRLRPSLRTRRGGRRATLPWIDGRDDWDQARAERARFRRLKRELERRAQAILERFERALREERRWSPERFRRDVLGHPLHRSVAAGLIWTAEGVPGFILGEEALQRWPEGAREVTLAHPARDGALPPTGSPQPFPQRVREAPERPELEGEVVLSESLRGLTRWGWRWEGPRDLAWAPGGDMRACVRLESPPGEGVTCRVDAVERRGESAVFEAEVDRDLARLSRSHEA